MCLFLISFLLYEQELQFFLVALLCEAQLGHGISKLNALIFVILFQLDDLRLQILLNLLRL